jgi:hypothetical protein
MKFEFQGLAVVLTFALVLSACQGPSNQRVASASNLPTTRSGGGVVRTSPVCREDEGGRHFGDITPFSENPFSGCWPQ